MPTSENSEYYVRIAGKRVGPFSLTEMQMRQVDPETEIWKVGEDGWKKASDFAELSGKSKKSKTHASRFSVGDLKDFLVEQRAAAIIVVVVILLIPLTWRAVASLKSNPSDGFAEIQRDPDPEDGEQSTNTPAANPQANGIPQTKAPGNQVAVKTNTGTGQTPKVEIKNPPPKTPAETTDAGRLPTEYYLLAAALSADRLSSRSVTAAQTNLVIDSLTELSNTTENAEFQRLAVETADLWRKRNQRGTSQPILSPATQTPGDLDRRIRFKADLPPNESEPPTDTNTEPAEFVTERAAAELWKQLHEHVGDRLTESATVKNSAATVRVVPEENNGDSPATWKVLARNSSGQLMQRCTLAVTLKTPWGLIWKDHFYRESWEQDEEWIVPVSPIWGQTGLTFTSRAEFSLWCEEAVVTRQEVTLEQQESKVVDSVLRLGQEALQQGELGHFEQIALKLAANDSLSSQQRKSALEMTNLNLTIKQNRDELLALLKAGSQFEGRWRFGTHSGSLGMKIIEGLPVPTKTVSHSTPDASTATPISEQIQLFDSEQPAEYRLFAGRIEFSPDTYRYTLILTGTAAGIEGSSRQDPAQVCNFLTKNDKREIQLRVKNGVFLGTLKTGEELILSPSETPETPARIKTWETEQPRPVFATVNAIPAELFPSIPETQIERMLLEWKADEIRRFDTLQLSTTQTPTPVRQVQFSSQGRSLFALMAEKEVRAWTTRNSKPMSAVGGGSQFATAPRDRYMAVAKNSGTVVLEGDRGKRLNQEFDSASQRVMFGPFGKTLYSTADNGLVSLFNMEGKRLAEARHSATVQAFAVSLDNKFFVTAAADRTLHLWDAKNELKHLKSVTGTLANVEMLRVSPGGKHILVVGRMGDSSEKPSTDEPSPNPFELQIWDLESRKQVYSAQLGQHARCIDLSLDWKTAIIGEEHGPLTVWDLTSGQQVARFIGHLGPPESIHISSDGRFAVSGGLNDGWIILWGLPAKSALLKGN